MYKSYKVILPLLLFVLSFGLNSESFAQLPNGAPAPCQPPAAGANSEFTLTFDPLPGPGDTYEAGDVVNICINVETYFGSNAGWFHGVVIDFPPAWDLSTINVTSTPPSCSGSGGGNWDYYDSVTSTGSGLTYGPGFYYDSGTAGPLDGNPGNNWGDPCTTTFGASFDFCFDITLAADCGGGSNPYDDTFIAPTLNITGDGDTGSWGLESSCLPEIDPTSPSGDPIVTTLNCCDADAGISPGTLSICENGTICLFDELLGTPDPGGIWIGPGGWSDTNDCGSFDPVGAVPGEYSYTVIGTGGCTNTAIITLEYIDLGNIANIAHCDPGPYDLMGGVIVPNGYPTTGEWYDPAGVFVPGGLVDPNGALTGFYEYQFYDANNCFTTLTANVIFSTGSSAGCDTSVEICVLDVPFCPFDVLGCNPNQGGQWVTYAIDPLGGPDVFIDYITNFDICFDFVNNAADNADYPPGDYKFIYLLGAPPCSPAFTDLFITIHDQANTGIPTTASICVTDPPVLLTDLLDEDGTGPVDTEWTWTNLATGATVPNLLDPSTFTPPITLNLNYAGGLPPGTQCSSESLLILNILPADADAGVDATYEICEDAAPIDMFTLLGGTPDPGGIWSGPAPFPTGTGGFYFPPNNVPGVYTYTVTTTCDSDVSTVTITETAQPNAGFNTTATVCETAGNVDLFGELTGSPVAGGTWTNQLTGTPVANPFNVAGQCGNTINFVYTVTSGVCTNFSVLTLNIECPPAAGPDVVLDYCADGSVVVDLTNEIPAGFPQNGTGSFFPSNIFTLDPANAGNYTYTVTGAPGSVCPSDIAIYTVNISPELTVTPAIAVCEPNQTEYTVSFTISGGTQPYIVDGVNLGASTTFTSATIPSGNIYSFTVSDSGLCSDVNVSGISPLCQCLATAQITTTSPNICEGSCANLDIAVSGGTGPYTVEYSDGINPPQSITIFGASQSITVCPTTSTTYSIVSVSDNFCVGTPTPGTATINVVPQPDAGPDVVVTPSFCGDGSNINLLGLVDPSADAGSFPVNNIPAIPGNTGVYTYTTNIGGGICPEDNALYTITIDPEITVSAATATCQPNQTEYGVVFNVLTGTNYSIEGTGIPPGSITGLNGAFSFNSASYGFIPAGTNYSFTISSSGSCPDVIVSGVSPVCTCLATAQFTSTSANVCEGSCTDLIISPSGGVYPYTVEYSDGANTFSETIFSGNATINVCPTAPTTYSITSVSDANCVGTPSPLTVTIGIETQPDAGSNVVLDYCGNGSTVNLFSELSPDADGGGVFTPSPNVVLNAINDGAVYTYTVSGTECPQDVATYTVNIEDQLSLSDVVVSCLPSQTEYTVSFTINGGSGAYNVTGANSQPPLGNSFVSLNIPIGQNYNFTISSVGGQCPAIPLTGAAPDCNCPATADFASGNVTICEGSCTDIEFELEGDAPYTVTYTINGVPATINTSDPNYTLTVCPTATTVYSLTGINDVNCTGSAFGNVTVTVDEQLNAGSDVTITYCADGSNINLVNELSPDAELGGTWSPPPAPSFPATETNSGLYTYTVGGNACPDDMASYNLLFESEIDVISVLGNCLPSQTEYQVSFQITQGVVPMTITSSVPGFVPVAVNSLPFSYTSVPIDFATNANYTFTVSSDNGLCNDWTITNPAPDCNCIAQGSFSGTTTICAGECTEIVFNGIGDAPFDITYTDSNGGSTNLLDIQNGHIITVCPAVETTYTLTAVSDSYCVGEVSGAPVTVGVDTQIQSTSVNEIIDADNEFFQVVIGLSGGNEATYSFSPAGGSYNSISGTYTSAWIPCGSGYNITVTDGGVCPALVINNPSFDCGCVSDAGTIDTAPLEVCIDGTITVTNNGDETMDGNDVLQYILHDGTGGTIQNVLGRTFDGVFNMNNYPVVGGQTYCIVAVVGNADFSGNVMLSDECTSVSNCVPVLVNPLPTATIVGGATVCVGENVGLIVTFTGTGPWDFTYTVNNTNATTESGITANPFTLNVNQTGNYAITTVTDSKGCNGFGQGVATVNNYVTPTATMTGEGDVCEGSGNGPIINFTGDAPYTFVYSIDGDVQPAITTSSSTYIIPAVEGGMYALTSLEGQYCTGTVSGSLFITINTPPTASISGGGEVCDGDLAPFVVNLTGEAPWIVNYAVDGIPQGQLTEGFVNFYEFESGVEGAYSIVSVSDANCVGSGIPSDANLVVNPIPTAEISSNTTGFCIGEEIELNVELDGVPPFDITYVLNEDTLTMIGLLTSTTMSMTPNVPINAEIILVEDGSNPTCSSEPFSSVFVDAGVLPNAPVLSDDSLCASYGSTRIGVPAAPGLSYSWEPQDNLDNPNVSNPLFLTGQPGPTPRFYTYVLTATNGECSSTDTMTVKVDPGPIARFNYSPDPVMSEDTRVYFNNNTVGGSGELIYYWEFDSLDTSDEENPNYQFPDGINDDYRISLTVIDAITGCMDDTYEILTVQPEMLIFVPNAFTPDGDGLNDLWGPVMKNVDPDNYTLQVLDRWGDVVFETTDPNQKWNGSLNGDDYYLGEGVYVWFIETKNNITLEEVDFSGKVTLIR